MKGDKIRVLRTKRKRQENQEPQQRCVRASSCREGAKHHSKPGRREGTHLHQEAPKKLGVE